MAVKEEILLSEGIDAGRFGETINNCRAVLLYFLCDKRELCVHRSIQISESFCLER